MGTDATNLRKVAPDNKPDGTARTYTRNTDSLTKALPTMAMSGTVHNLTPRGMTQRSLPNQPSSKIHPEGAVKPMSPLRRWCVGVLENRRLGALLSVLTIYCLFGDDFRSAFCSKSADDGFFAVAFICLLLFLFEFVVSCFCKPGYLFSFYFYLDIAATLSLIPDIGFIWSPLSGGGTVSSVSQAGSKAGRIIRVVRVIRLVRIVKLIKWKHSTEEKNLVIVESKTGGRMAEMTIRRVVMIVLFLCFVLPAFDGGYNEPFNGFESRGFDTIHQMTTTSTDVTQSPIFLNTFGSWFYYTTDDIVYLDMYNISNTKMNAMFNSFSFPETDVSTAQVAKILPSQSAVLELYRVNELRSITSTGCFNNWNGSDLVVNPVLVSTSCQSVVWFDVATSAKATAITSIYRTLFILAVLLTSSLSFVHVARIIVLNPIERMMATVKQLAESPLGKHLSIDKDQQRFAQDQGFETAVLEATLDKI
ncbi:Voltage-gated Ion Channel (VIC) Superfamily, partial [Achlya hypogyna]